jgi:hypothetical protein
MKELKTEFQGKGQVRGFLFTQLKKNEAGYIYQVNTGAGIHYEVFKHKKNTQYDCISYPSNKAFGIWAWTHNTLERAEAKLSELVALKNQYYYEVLKVKY